MKKIVLYTFAAMFLLGCSSREDKAKALIRKYMKEKLNDPSSYQPVSYQIDSTFTSFYDTEEGMYLYDLGMYSGEYYKKREMFDSLASSYLNNKPIPLDKYEEMRDSAKYYYKKYEEAKLIFNKRDEIYKGEFNGWRAYHTYRSKNGFGAIGLGQIKFYFDKDLTKIVNTQE